MTAPTFVAVLPAIDYDLATSCIQSMDWQLANRVYLIDNSERLTIADWASPRGALAPIDREPGNLGVPRSWNRGIEWMRANDASYLVIISQSVLFGPSGGRDFLDELETRRPDWLMHFQYGWKLIALSADLIERVGRFDPVFSPGYREEVDFLYRCHLAGLPSPQYNDGRFDQVVIDAESRGDALMIRSGTVRMDFGANTAAYLNKWNGEKLQEQWTHPYNDPSLDWTYTGPPPLPEGEGLAEEHSS